MTHRTDIDTGAADAAPPSANDGALDGALGVLLNTDFPLKSRQQHMASLRRSQAALVPRIEDALIKRCDDQATAIGRLGEVIEQAKALTAKLTAAPLREGLFLGSVTLPDGECLVRVQTATQEALVPVLDADLPAQLLVGDRVHLNADSNAVIGKSSDAAAEPGVVAEALRWLPDQRLLVRHRDEEIVVRAAGALEPDRLAPGDRVRLDRRTWLAIEPLPADPRSALAPSDEATGLPPEALAGCDDIRDGTLRRIACAVARPETAALYGLREQRPGILLGGPPGVGKTTLARIAAHVLQAETGRACTVRKVNGAELLSPYVGETEQRIRTLLREVHRAGEQGGWSLLFIDEVDAIARTRGGPGQNVHGDRFLSTWLSEWEGFEGRAHCIVMAATNRIDMLDAAFRSRFSHEIQLPRPRMDAARAIFRRHLAPDLAYHPGAEARGAMIERALARLYLPNAAGATVATLRFRDGKSRPVQARELISGRLIEMVCTEAREQAFLRHVAGGHPGVAVDDMDGAVEAALDRLRGTLSLANVHDQLADLPQDLQVVAVDAAPRARASLRFLGEAA